MKCNAICPRCNAVSNNKIFYTSGGYKANHCSKSDFIKIFRSLTLTMRVASVSSTSIYILMTRSIWTASRGYAKISRIQKILTPVGNLSPRMHCSELRKTINWKSLRVALIVSLGDRLGSSYRHEHKPAVKCLRIFANAAIYFQWCQVKAGPKGR